MFNLNISFIKFNLQYSGEGCWEERVVIYFELNATLGRYCGRRYKWSVFAAGKPIVLQFFTFHHSKSKFKLIFQLGSKMLLRTTMVHSNKRKEFNIIERNHFYSPFSWFNKYRVLNKIFYNWNIFVAKNVQVEITFP